MAPLSFKDKVAVVTGAGGGLGRAYALLLGSRGAKVVVNDLGGDSKGEGNSSRAADVVVDEIRNAGGTAVANYDSVEAGDKIIQTALDNFGRIDILINNAGILRDRSFARISDTDWDLVHRVHLRGSFLVTRAAFPVMKKQGYGRIIMTASTSGIFGNFGQANYSAAKLGVLGLSNTVAIEGQKYNVNCNTVAPFGGTRMTENVMPPDLFKEYKPELVAPIVAWLCHEDCTDTGGLYMTGGGFVNKFRWECTEGVMCRKSRSEPATPESVRDNWDKICEFDNSEIFESNAEASAHIIGSMSSLPQGSIGPKPASATTSGPLSAVGVTVDADTFNYDPEDVILYALGIGVSTQDEDGLKFLYENSEDFSPLPTFVVVPSQAAIMGGALFSKISGWSPDLTKLLHGEMYIENLKPLPTKASLVTSATVSDVLDKGSGAVMIIDSVSKDVEGNEYSRAQWSLFVVGEGNFGGPRTSKVNTPLKSHPTRAPDVTKEVKTGIDQAALYRLSGDMNPLHIDPSFAAMGGFNQPILHGLCSYGITARVVLATYCESDVSKFKAMKTRFAKPVLPGQTLVISMWKESTRVFFTTTVKETGQDCLTGGYVDISEGDAESMTSVGEEAAGKDVFTKIAYNVAADPTLVSKVKAIFYWEIKRNDKVAAQWTLDLKEGFGRVYQGLPEGKARPDITLTVAEDDLKALAAGKLNAQSAFMSGRLKVKGNVMLAQKLQPLFRHQAKM